MRIAYSQLGKAEHFSHTLCLVMGNEDALRREVIDQLIEQWLPEGEREFGLVSLDGDASDLRPLLALLQTPPMFSTSRATVVRSAERMGKEQQNELAATLKMMKSTCGRLVLDWDSRGGGQGGGRSPVAALLKHIDQNGLIVQCNLAARAREADTQLSQLAQDLARKLHKDLRPTVAHRLVQRLEPDWGIVEQEVRKLALYCGERPQITDADVAALVPETRAEVIFRLVDAVAEGSTARALGIAAHLSEQGEALELILWSLTRHFRWLLQMRYLMDLGLVRGVIRPEQIPDEIKELLPEDQSILDVITQQSWRLRPLQQQAGRFSEERLARAFELLLQTDLHIKGVEGGIEDRRLALDMLCVELCIFDF